MGHVDIAVPGICRGVFSLDAQRVPNLEGNYSISELPLDQRKHECDEVLGRRGLGIDE